MTEQEKLERRIVLAQAMGYRVFKNPQFEGASWSIMDPDGTVSPILCGNEYTAQMGLPDFDKDPEARERLLEWFTLDSGFHIGQICWQVEWEVLIKSAEGDIQGWYYGDTYAETLVSAIYAAVKAREDGA